MTFKLPNLLLLRGQLRLQALTSLGRLLELSFKFRLLSAHFIKDNFLVSDFDSHFTERRLLLPCLLFNRGRLLLIFIDLRK